MHFVVQSTPLQMTPAFWHAFCPMHVMSQVSAEQRTPAVHAVPVRHFTVHSLPLHVTPPEAHELEPSHVMLQRSVELHSIPAVHDEPCLHVTSQNFPPHTSFAFVHALVPSQVTLHPAACEQSTPVWQAVPPMHRISQVWPGGQTAAHGCVHGSRTSHRRYSFRSPPRTSRGYKPVILRRAERRHRRCRRRQAGRRHGC